MNRRWRDNTQAKGKRTNNDLQNTKQNTKEWATRAPEAKASYMLNSDCENKRFIRIRDDEEPLEFNHFVTKRIPYFYLGMNILLWINYVWSDYKRTVGFHVLALFFCLAYFNTYSVLLSTIGILTCIIEARCTKFNVSRIQQIQSYWILLSMHFITFML